MSILGEGLGLWQSIKNQEQVRETNDLQYQMWQKQLDYDRPINQVARLKEAGLNPALMYGTGSGANTSAPAPRMEAPQGKTDYRLDPGDVVAVQQARLIGEQTRALKRENDTLEKTPGALKGDSSFTRSIRGVINELGGSYLGQKARSFWRGAKSADVPNFLEGITPGWMMKKYDESKPRGQRLE